MRELDLEQKVAYVEPREVDYYTQPVLDTSIRLLERRATRLARRRPAGFGELTYPGTVAMKKIGFRTLDAIGYHPLARRARIRGVRRTPRRGATARGARPGR